VWSEADQSVSQRSRSRLWAGAGEDSDLVARLQREARATAAIQSPHVVEILDVVEDEHDEVWVVMELLEGESLAERIRRLRSLSPAETATLVVQLLVGLEAAHAQKVVHRDLKPANVFVHRRADDEPVVKLLDFGISKWSGDTGGGGPMTATGATLRTPNYMAPEQATQPHGRRAQRLYSVRAILYSA
jgi:serine/threonine-protein kinase